MATRATTRVHPYDDAARQARSSIAGAHPCGRPTGPLVVHRTPTLNSTIRITATNTAISRTVPTNHNKNSKRLGYNNHQRARSNILKAGVGSCCLGGTVSILAVSLSAVSRSLVEAAGIRGSDMPGESVSISSMGRESDNCTSRLRRWRRSTRSRTPVTGRVGASIISI